MIYFALAVNIISEKFYRVRSILVKMIGDSPKLRIIDFFLDDSLFDFTKKKSLKSWE